MGDKKRANEAGKALLEYGKRHSNIRSIVLGHNSIGLSELVSGDYPSAIECYKKAVQIAQDPFYREYSRVFLGLSYLLNEQFDEAEEALQKVLDFSQEWGFESSWGMISKACLGVVTVVKGELGSGLRAIQEGSTICKEIETLPYYAIFEHTLGKVYLQIVQGEGPKNLSFLVKNIGFLLKNVPFAGQKAEKHFLKAIEVAKEIGAKGILGQAYLDLGLLHKAKKRIDQANKCISEAAHIFEQCEAQVFLKQAKEALKSLGLI